VNVAIVHPNHWRLKCSTCRRWMRFGEPTEATPATRRPAPHAGGCTDCPVKHYLGCGCPKPEDIPW